MDKFDLCQFGEMLDYLKIVTSSPSVYGFVMFGIGSEHSSAGGPKGLAYTHGQMSSSLAKASMVVIVG